MTKLSCSLLSLRQSNGMLPTRKIWVYICLKPAMLDTAQIQVSPEILSLIAEIDEFKGAFALDL